MYQPTCTRFISMSSVLSCTYSVCMQLFSLHPKAYKYNPSVQFVDWRDGIGPVSITGNFKFDSTVRVCVRNGSCQLSDIQIIYF